MRDEGCGIPVRVNRNGCVDTMTFPGDRNTNVGNEFQRDASRPEMNYRDANPIFRRNEDVYKVKQKKPPTFDGSTSWQDFLVQFEMIAYANKWDDGQKAYELATSLRGVAQGIVTDIEPEKRLNYDRLVIALTSRFEPANQANMYKSQMNSYYRKPGQTLPEMAQEIRRITRLAYPTAPIEIRDQLAKDCFVRAVNDPKIQLSIFQREPKSIDDCVRFGLDYEAFVVDQKRFGTKQGLRMQYETDNFEEENLMSHIAKMGEQMDRLTAAHDQKGSRGGRMLLLWY